MIALPIIRVWLASLGVAVVLSGASVEAEDFTTAAVAPWQEVISSQIQAFRDHDAPAAFSHAGIAFQATFPDAETFFIAIIQSGYAPIMDSGSHSFGAYRKVGEAGVVQRVRFTGKDQLLYDAVYKLTEESGQWRVQGVQLMRPSGVAI